MSFGFWRGRDHVHFLRIRGPGGKGHAEISIGQYREKTRQTEEIDCGTSGLNSLCTATDETPAVRSVASADEDVQWRQDSPSRDCARSKKQSLLDSSVSFHKNSSATGNVPSAANSADDCEGQQGYNTHSDTATSIDMPAAALRSQGTKRGKLNVQIV